MRVLITGGAGFIGSHLCDKFIFEGYEVEILDNLSTGSKKNVSHLAKQIVINQGDIRDKELVESLVSTSDLVIHMAAALGVNNILENTTESISTNILGSEIVLGAALKFSKRIVIASTSEIYGKNSNQPLSELDDRVIGSPQKLRWSYSDAKAIEEATAYYLYLKQNLAVTTVRLFNTVGPRQTGKYGMVVPRFIEAAVKNKPLRIFGDGSQSRVFCHVLDTVDAIFSLSNNDRSIGEVFNIGGIGEISILDLANTTIKILESSSIIEFIRYEEAYSQGFEEMFRRVPDISKIYEFIKWKPKYGIEQIILDVAKYFR
jgi:UDP-glucose 4-epimerase